MEAELTTFLIVCPLVFLAGFVDAIAGGGGLISLPAYLLGGVPIHYAIATNKLSSTAGTMAATLRFLKNRLVDIPIAVPSVITALIGSVIGAKFVLLTDEKIMQYLLVAVLPVAAYYTLKKKPNIQFSGSISRRKALVGSVLISFCIGVYDGFYGPGTGTFLVLLYSSVSGMDIRTASGNAKIVNLSSNISALVVFLVNGKVFVVLGVTAALFSIAGNYLGSGLAIKKGASIVRPIILTVLSLLFIKIIVDILS